MGIKTETGQFRCVRCGKTGNVYTFLHGLHELALERTQKEDYDTLAKARHLDANDIVEFEDMFRKLPVPMVIDHMARVSAKDGLEQKPFKVLLDFMKDEKVWVKVCGSERVSSGGPPFHDAIPFAQALIKVAPDRVLWGTDWPHPNVGKHMPNDGDLVDLIPLMMPDAAIRQKVLVDNPARLYGFE